MKRKQYRIQTRPERKYADWITSSFATPTTNRYDNPALATRCTHAIKPREIQSEYGLSIVPYDATLGASQVTKMAFLFGNLPLGNQDTNRTGRRIWVESLNITGEYTWHPTSPLQVPVKFYLYVIYDTNNNNRATGYDNDKIKETFDVDGTVGGTNAYGYDPGFLPRNMDNLRQYTVLKKITFTIDPKAPSEMATHPLVEYHGEIKRKVKINRFIDFNSSSKGATGTASELPGGNIALCFAGPQNETQANINFGLHIRAHFMDA